MINRYCAGVQVLVTGREKWTSNEINKVKCEHKTERPRNIKAPIGAN